MEALAAREAFSSLFRPCSSRRKQVDDYPKGYPSLAAFLDSDNSFMLYRRFGVLQARLLLDSQDELRKLEVELNKMDRRDSKRDSSLVQTRDLHEDDSRSRQELLQRIRRRFCEYSKVLCAAQKLMAFNKPADSEYKSVEKYVNNTKPLVKEEGSFIYHKEDFVTLRPGREHAWLDHSIEKLLRLLNCNLIEYVFCSKESKAKSRNLHQVYYTRARIDRLAITIITVMILILLVIPIYILFQLSDDNNNTGIGRTNGLSIAVLLVFTLAFSAVLLLFTRAKRHEILAASAAYCAVLVVFFGNVGPRNA